MGELSPLHWMIVIGVVVLLFGSKRLPDAARAVGQSLRILQAEAGGLRRDGKHETVSPVDRTAAGDRTEQDALAERAGTTPGHDRAGGGDHGVPGTGGVDDRDDALPGAGQK